MNPAGWLTRLGHRLPNSVGAPLSRFAGSFAEGINWPRGPLRSVNIMLASLAMKLLAATQFFWAGLAFGIDLQAAQYLFIMVFIGFLVILGHFARLAGSFFIGSLFVLRLLGVPEEKALAMVLVVEAANLLSVASIGSLTLRLRKSLAVLGAGSAEPAFPIASARQGDTCLWSTEQRSYRKAEEHGAKSDTDEGSPDRARDRQAGDAHSR